MSTTKSLTELAVGFAAGSYTEEALLEMTGDDDMVSTIIVLAGGTIGAGLAVGLTKAVLDTEPVTAVTEVVDDVLDAINPFNW